MSAIYMSSESMLHNASLADETRPLGVSFSHFNRFHCKTFLGVGRLSSVVYVNAVISNIQLDQQIYNVLTTTN